MDESNPSESVETEVLVSEWESLVSQPDKLMALDDEKLKKVHMVSEIIHNYGMGMQGLAMSKTSKLLDTIATVMMARGFQAVK